MSQSIRGALCVGLLLAVSFAGCNHKVRESGSGDLSADGGGGPIDAGGVDQGIADLGMPDLQDACPADRKFCAGECIALTACCTAAECPSTDNGNAICGQDHACVLSCNTGFRTCGPQCIPGNPIASAPDGGTFFDGGNGSGNAFDGGNAPDGGELLPSDSCCTDSDCTVTGETCPSPGSPCACPSGQKACATSNSCIPVGNCCAPSDCPGAVNGSPTCVAGVCGSACNPGYGKCGGTCQISTAQCCSATDCSGNNISAACDVGICDGACNSGFADCNNNKVADGCEVSTQTDAVNCGGCGAACSIANITPSCVAGQCNGACDSGFADCDGNKRTNGCETSTATDATNCGTCGLLCSSANITTATCTAGACGGACNTGFADCDNNKTTNGCEVNTQSSPANCGGCGVTCSNAHISSPTCGAGTCNGACNPGFLDCNGNKKTDGCEVTSSTDTANCGGCGILCSSNNVVSAACTTGTCTSACNTGFTDCNGNKQTDGCEVATGTDPNNCGSCGGGCSSFGMAMLSCAAGTCNGTCTAGYADCDSDKKTDGCEVQTGVDPANCGGCGIMCSGNNMAAVTCGAGSCNGACATGFADCDSNKLIDGCEINTTSDAANCGGCNIACSSNHVTAASCGAGTCNSTCSTGYTDCNSDLKTDGCEVATGADPSNCGGCGQACSTNNMASQSCTGGSCDGACTAGFADCNANKKTDGCEINTKNDINNCGGCGIVCTAANGSATCSNGVCAVLACSTGFGDCNLSAVDGCETNTTSTPTACGSCSTSCSTNNISTPACAGSTCTGACNTGFSDCNADKLADGCETATGTDAANCGGCGSVCSTNHITTPTCAGGSCNGACAAGFADCNGNKKTDGCEISTNTDINNCGGCGIVCSTANGSPICTNGLCAVSMCTAGFGDCNMNPVDGCETNITTTPSACGSCTNNCSSNNISTRDCAGGICDGACNTGFSDCNADKLTDGCEISTGADPNNCGGCGQACSTNHMASQSCTGGTCDGACTVGFADCNANKKTDGCEINTKTDINNCGGCGIVCTAANGSATCSNGACVIVTCSAGYGDCNMIAADGCETNTTTTPTACGSCANSCSTNHISTLACGGGICTGACNTGFSDCNANKLTDGCETATGTDAANCGGCGTVCSSNHIASLTCAGGSCNGSCAPGFADCDLNKQTNGCEVSSQTDVNNCGGCGIVCTAANGTPSCQAGVCKVSACNAGFADCNGLAADGCEVNTNTSAGNCGACGSVCSNNNIASPVCSAGTCTGACNAGFGDCNGNKKTDGCEVNTTTSTSNCGACGNACTAPNGTPSCAASTCGVASCSTNYHNTDGLPANGCECNTAVGNSGSENACSTLKALGSIAYGTAVNATGTIAGTATSQWYSATFASGGGATPLYHPHVIATTNTGSTVFVDVTNAVCSGAQALGCATEGTYASLKTAFETNQTAGDSTTPSGTFTWATPGAPTNSTGAFPPGSTMYIHVYTTAATSCSTFTLTVENQ